MADYIVRSGRGGEVMVIAPSGRVEFMGLWRLFQFCLTAFRNGHEVKVQDD